MLNTEAAYIAGIVDGESYISICKHNDRDTGYSVHLKIFNTNIDLLKWIRKTTKLGIIILSRDKTEKYKPKYEYSLRKYECKKFLLPLLPYLIIKKRQAELILQYIKLRKGHRYSPLTIKEIKERENIYEQIKPLNKQGQLYRLQKNIFRL